jgi:hypothetical protein
MKPRAKTIQERFGFKDEELPQPKHDEIMFWLDANIESVVAGLFPQEWTEAEISSQERLVGRARGIWLEGFKDGHGVGPEEAKHLRILDADIQNWRSHADRDKERECRDRRDAYLLSLAQNLPHPGPVPSRPPCKILSRKWEYPIMDRTYVVGFVDFCVGIGRPSVWLDGVEQARAFAPSWKISTDRVNLLFEVKTEIRSLGELMRQINLYRAYEDHGQFFVVSPDDRFTSTLESQNIGFVKYTG